MRKGKKLKHIELEYNDEDWKFKEIFRVRERFYPKEDLTKNLYLTKRETKSLYKFLSGIFKDK